MFIALSWLFVLSCQILIQVHALPSSPQNSGSTFSIPQVDTGKRLRNGPLSVAQTYRKYGAPIPADLESAISLATAYASGLQTSNLTSRSVPAIPEDKYDSVYLSPVTVGTNDMMLDLDTGSGDLWVFSTLMPSSQTTANRGLYAPAWPASIYLGLTWSAAYGDGSSASGLVFQDRVLAGTQSPTTNPNNNPQAGSPQAGVSSPYQAIQAALTASSLFLSDATGSGVIGLGFPVLNTIRPTYSRPPSFLEAIAPTLQQPIFTAALKHGEPGSWDFGYLNASKYVGALGWANVDAGRGWWEFNATGWVVGNGVIVSGTIDLIADTGTTLLYLPPSIVAAYYGAVPGARNNATEGGWIFPCSAALPSFSLVVGGALQSVPGSYLNFGPSDRRGNCFGGMQENTGIGVGILGDVFLKALFVVFDRGMLGTGSFRVGFAKQVGVWST